MSIIDLARAYHQAVHAAETAAVPSEEEAQLTTPVSNLLSGLAAEAGLGTLQLVRETRLDSTRPTRRRRSAETSMHPIFLYSSPRT